MNVELSHGYHILHTYTPMITYLSFRLQKKGLSFSRRGSMPRIREMFSPQANLSPTSMGDVLQDYVLSAFQYWLATLNGSQMAGKSHKHSINHHVCLWIPQLAIDFIYWTINPQTSASSKADPRLRARRFRGFNLKNHISVCPFWHQHVDTWS